MKKFLFKLMDLVGWTILFVLIHVTKSWSLVVVFMIVMTIVNTTYFIRAAFLNKRLNFWYEFSIKNDEIHLHFSPRILLGFWANSRVLTKYRNESIEQLKEKGYTKIVGESVSLSKINASNGVEVEKELNKWGWSGIITTYTTAINTIANARNIMTCTVSRKLYLLLFKNKFNRYTYYSNS